MAYCSNCGADLIKGDTFCSNCGTRVDSDFDPAPAKPIDSKPYTLPEPINQRPQSQEFGQRWSSPNQTYDPNQPYRPNQQYYSNPQHPQGYGSNPTYNQPYGQNPRGYQPYGRNVYSQDRIEWWIFVLSFFIFPIGLVYYFANRREKPESTRNLLYVTIAGIFFYFFL